MSWYTDDEIKMMEAEVKVLGDQIAADITQRLIEAGNLPQGCSVVYDDSPLVQAQRERERDHVHAALAEWKRANSAGWVDFDGPER